MAIAPEEERLIFSNLVALNIFFIATILYLTTSVPNSSIIGKAWIYATVVSITLAVLLRISSNFVGKKFFIAISYLCIVISILTQLCAIGFLLRT